MTKKILLFFLALSFLFFTGCPQPVEGEGDKKKEEETTKPGGEEGNTNNSVKVTGITFSESDLVIAVGSTKTVVASIVPDNATDKSISWVSSDETVATVESGKITALAKGSTTIKATTTDGSFVAECSLSVVKAIPVTNLYLSLSAPKVAVGEALKIPVRYNPSNTTDTEVIWEIANSSIATVDETGEIKGLKEGITTVTVKSKNKPDVVASKELTVVKDSISVESVYLSYKNAKNVYKTMSEIITVNVYPAEASNKSVTWTSSNPEVLTVEDNGVHHSLFEQKATIKGVSPGTSTITVTTEDGAFTATYEVTVEDLVPVESISLDKTELDVPVNGQEYLTATILPENATIRDIVWTSSDPDIANVSRGSVRGYSAGSVTITATTKEGNKIAQCTVKVAAVPVESISFVNFADGEETTLKLGGAHLNFYMGTDINILPENASDKTFSITSSDSSVVSVENGYAKAVGSGSATVTLTTTDGSKKVSVKINVPEPTKVESISFNKTPISNMVIGDKEYVHVTITPNDAYDQSYTIKSSNPDIAEVGTPSFASTLVTAKAAGTTTITITTNDGNHQVSYDLTVTEPILVTDISVTTSASIIVGKTRQLSATISPSNATDKGVIWSSSNTSVATVDKDGIVTGLKIGTATITAKSSSNSDIFAVSEVTIEPEPDGSSFDRAMPVRIAATSTTSGYYGEWTIPAYGSIYLEYYHQGTQTIPVKELLLGYRADRNHNISFEVFEMDESTTGSRGTIPKLDGYSNSEYSATYLPFGKSYVIRISNSGSSEITVNISARIDFHNN